MTVEIIHDLPFEDYLAIEALSYSGMCDLLRNPLEFWTNCRFLNPDYEDNDTASQANGRAMHKRVVEGREAFNMAYAPEFEGTSDHLRTQQDIKDRLKAIGEKVGGNKPELIQRLLAVQPEAKILDVEAERYRENNPGKTFLPFEQIAEIEKAAAMIEGHPQLAKAFQGGEPEVSLIGEIQGVRVKARIDYLKAKAVCEYKTFSNFRRLQTNKAIMHAVASEKYHLQAVVYMTLLDMAGANDRQWLWVFQQQGKVPIARGLVFPRMSMFDVGVAQMEHAIHLYKENLAHYGQNPWVDTTPIATVDDTEFPVWATE